MTNSRAEVITSVERRRRWSQAEKKRLVAESLEPGASVSVSGHLFVFRGRRSDLVKMICHDGQGACLFTN